VTTVLYVASLARSGSTLLELLLGTHPEVETAGELQILTHELRGDNRIRCGCGAPVPECEFWSEVARGCDPRDQPAPQLDFFREHHDWGHTIRPARLREVTSRPVRRSLERMIEQYGRNTQQLAEVIADVHERGQGRRPRVVVDASKDPYRLLWLARSKAVDLRVVHLIRDPRGSVHSLSKDEPEPLRRDVTAFRRSMAWIIENELIHQTCAAHLGPETWARVRYEELATDPLTALRRVLGLVGLSPHETMLEDYLSVSVHTIAGNPMRGSRHPVTLDERWRRELPSRTRAIVSAVTAPVRNRYR
jgi:hypothetical protein